jgi:MSHA biogenesis protein MshM
MYLDHFGLTQSPFGITPNPAFFYSGSKRGDILEALIYAVSSGEGIIKVTGEVGSGKTMLCRMLESLMPLNVEVIYLVNPTLGREDVVYAIAGELGLNTSGRRPDEMIRMLQADLINKHAEGKQVVLLVEEAQAMALDTLEEIRLFSNLETAQHKLLQIILFGQPELDENLALPRMRQLKERITHSFKVPPMPREVIPEFLMFRMRAAGYRGPHLFDNGAIGLLAIVSKGIVRRINVLADKALLAAYAENAHMVTAKHLRSAIRDSEFSQGKKELEWRRTALILGGVLAVLAVCAALAWYVLVFRATDALTPVVKAPLAAKPAPVVPPPINKIKELSPAYPLFERRLKASPAWLAAQAVDEYSIQLALISSDSPDQIERFLQQLSEEVDLDQMVLYRTALDGADRYGIAYGSFAVKADAVAKLNALSEKTGKKFQLRTIGGIVQGQKAVAAPAQKK